LRDLNNRIGILGSRGRSQPFAVIMIALHNKIRQHRISHVAQRVDSLEHFVLQSDGFLVPDESADERGAMRAHDACLVRLLSKELALANKEEIHHVYRGNEFRDIDFSVRKDRVAQKVLVVYQVFP